MAKNTEKQSEAINHESGNILVSASAGSGKTYVMTERVVRLIAEGKANLNEFLCVTFTELAAREMKGKLNKKILEKAQEAIQNGETEKRDRLISQLQLLPTASVSTIHSFCTGLLREYFYDAQVDPCFKVLDENQSKMLVNRAIDALFECLYDEDNEDFNYLLSLYFNKRSDFLLKQSVVEAYKTLRAEPDYFNILQKGELYYTKEGVYEIYEFFKNEFSARASDLKNELDKLLNCIQYSEKLHNFAGELVEYLQEIQNCENVFKMKQLALRVLRKPSLSKNAGEDECQEHKIFSSFYGGEFKTFKEELKGLALEGEEQDVKALDKTRRAYLAFCKIVRLFEEHYKSEKKEACALDFADLEHYAFDLLKNPDVEKEVKSRYKYIFIDEYQDTSGIQEQIISKIANDNLFLVGDVKQSIYGFRGCSPESFIQKEKLYNQNPKKGKVVNLDDNFRSSKPVIQTVNNLFSDIMTASFGGTQYKDNPMVCGASFKCENDGEIFEDMGHASMQLVQKASEQEVCFNEVYSIESHLKKLGESGNGFAKFAEGEAIASLIHEIVGSDFYHRESKTVRKLRYSDITILLRSANSQASVYATALDRAGIPVSAETRKSLGDYAEVAFMANLVQLINNFNQDIPLVSVLKSPIGGFSEKQLFKIRENHKDGNFYQAYYAYMLENDEQSDDLSKKLRAFDGYFKEIRALAEFMPCAELLTKIVREKNIDSHLLAQRLGSKKLDRVNAFIHASGSKKQMVSEFASEMDEVLKALNEKHSDSNSVKIMSIHASKGLEFPVVILASIGHAYNREDFKGEFITDKNFGVALYCKDGETMRKSETAIRTYAKYLKKKSMQEEELRLLYVAMTRAENRLYVVGEYKNGELEKFIKQSHGVCDGRISACYADVFAKSDMPVEEVELKDLKEREVKQVLISEKNDGLIQEMAKNITFKYEPTTSGFLSQKRSVTSAAHFDEDDGSVYEYAPIFGDTSAKKGTAYHRFLELCDFSKTAESEFNRLIEAHLLTKEEQNLIDLNRLNAILQMDIFKRLEGYTLYREQPFTCFMPKKLIEEGYEGEAKILVQGIIDLLAVRENEAIIVDYKFTALSNDEQTVRRYEKQLRLYEYAVKEVLKKQVTALYVANIYSAKLIQIK